MATFQDAAREARYLESVAEMERCAEARDFRRAYKMSRRAVLALVPEVKDDAENGAGENGAELLELARRSDKLRRLVLRQTARRRRGR